MSCVHIMWPFSVLHDFQFVNAGRGGVHMEEAYPSSKDLCLLVVELSGDTQSPANRDQLLS